MQVSLLKHLRYSFGHDSLELKSCIQDWLYDQDITFKFLNERVERAGPEGSIFVNKWFIEFEKYEDAVAFKLVWL